MKEESIISKFTTGLKEMRPKIPVDALEQIGFNNTESSSLNNDLGDPVFISVYEKKECKAVHTEVEHETASEGTLYFQNLWVNSEAEACILRKFKDNWPNGTRF